MTHIRFIRETVFKVNQIDFAKIANVGQATVSRWEKGVSSPSLDDLRRIRAEAARRGIPWDHEWLFGAIPSAAEHRAA